MLATLLLALDVAFFLAGPHYRDQELQSADGAELGKEKGSD
jgi:hypothetical protein